MAESFDSQLGLVDEIGLVLAFAFVGGFIAGKLRLQPIVGYIAAGLVVGPFTPGFIADVHLAEQLGEIGIVLLMFGVGLHFSIPDLMRVRKIAVPGALMQSLATTAIAILLAIGFGWSFGGGLVLGLAVSVARTIVLVRALEEREKLETTAGHIAVGWLIVEDMFSVRVLVLLPVLAVSLGGSQAASALAEDTVMGAMLHEGDSLLALGARMVGIGDSVFSIIGIAFLNVAVLGFAVLKLGRAGMFWVLKQIERLHSAELFTLAVVVLALMVAVVAKMVFGLSIALGAFLGGVMMAGSSISHKVGEDVPRCRRRPRLRRSCGWRITAGRSNSTIRISKPNSGSTTSKAARIPAGSITWRSAQSPTRLCRANGGAPARACRSPSRRRGPSSRKYLPGCCLPVVLDTCSG